MMPNDVFSQWASNPPPQLNPPLKAGLSGALLVVVRSLNLNVKIFHPSLHCGTACRNRISLNVFIFPRQGFFFRVSSPNVEFLISLSPCSNFYFSPATGHQDLKSNSHLFIELECAKSPTHSAAPLRRLSPHLPTATPPPPPGRAAGSL